MVRSASLSAVSLLSPCAIMKPSALKTPSLSSSARKAGVPSFTSTSRLRALSRSTDRGNILRTNKPTSNIAAVAREICALQIRRPGMSSDEIEEFVDGHWHVPAAQLEAGLIDEFSNWLIPFDLDRSLEAFRDWCRRHRD
jgi:hypothetical protein